MLSYALSEHSARHEPWLIEWSLDWFDCETRKLSIVRENLNDGTRFQIAVDIPDCQTELDECHSRLVDRLDTRVDDLDSAWRSLA